tara:strand:- start:5047 stop:5721 length:675 start_codon:yes stop_codon:yes gene_type:complete
MVELFSKELKEGTSKSHSAAENTKFVSGFLKGVVDPEQYRQLLTNFYYVYQTMENCIRETKDPLVKSIYYPEVERVNELERDLRFYYGPQWRSLQIPTEACNTYCYRINQIATDDPYLLIAHHYTRYIGDLSGGKILRGIAEKALNNPRGEGLWFYDFPHIKDAKEWKNRYRKQLDQMPLTNEQKNAIITEANYAFRLNMYLFDEIQGSSTKGLWKLLLGFLRR